jgi:uncharacterized lipoprotein YmbA
MRSKLFLLGALTLLSSCTVFPDSPAAKLYALDLPRGLKVGDCSLRFSLRDVQIPGYLDRPEVLLNVVGSRIDVSPLHLWAAPLTKEATRLTGLGLQERMGKSAMMPYPVRQFEKPDWLLTVVIQRFVISADGSEMEAQLVRQPFSVAQPDPKSDNPKNDRVQTFSVRASLPAFGTASSDGKIQAFPLEQRANQAAVAFGQTLGKALDSFATELAQSKTCS